MNRASAVARALGALLLSGMLVVGVPLLLVATVGNPLPDHLPSVQELRILLTQNGDGFANFVMSVLAICIWVLWAQLVVSMAVEVVATVRRSETRHLPTFPGIQTLASRLVASMMLVTTLTTSSVLAPAVGALTFDDVAVAPAATEFVIESPGPASAASEVVLPASGTEQFGFGVNGSTRPAAVADGRSTGLALSHRAELWDLAEAAYGDGTSWKVIAQANAGRLDADGSPITPETEVVAAGTHLELPGVIDPGTIIDLGTVTATASSASTAPDAPNAPDVGGVDGGADGARWTETAADPPSVPPAPQTEVRPDDAGNADGAGQSRAASDDLRLHVVEPGESMWSIAQTEVEARLDRAASTVEVEGYWVDVVAANADVPSGDVDLIHPGDELRMPAGSPGLSDTADAADQADAVGGAEDTESGGAEDQGTASGEDEGAGSGDVDNEPQRGGVDGSDLVVTDGPAPWARGSDAETTSSLSGSQPDAPGEPGAVAGTAPDEAQADRTPPAAPIDTSDLADPSVPAPARPRADVVADTRGGGRVSVPALGMATLGAAILSAGVVGAVRRRRDLQRRTRPGGTIGRPVSESASAFEAAMAHASGELIESKTGLGWRALPISTLGALGAHGPVQLRSDGSSQLILEPMVDNHGQPEALRIEIDESASDEAIDHQVRHGLGLDAGPNVNDADPTDDNPGAIDEPAPTTDEPPVLGASTSLLVGTDVANGEAVFLDLASAGTVELIGDHDAVRRFARTAVLDLAVSDRCDDLCVIAVAVGLELGDLERVRTVDDFPQALAEAIRCGHAGPDSPTAVVIASAVPAAPDDGSLDALRQIGVVVIAPPTDTAAAASPDSAAVASPDTAAAASPDSAAFGRSARRCRVHLDGDHAVLEPSGTVVELVALGDHEYRCVAELVDTTSALAVEVVRPDQTVDDVLDVTPTAACPVEPGPIEVKVLGPVSVAGADSFSSLKAVDVVAYLAFHRHGVDADQIKSWVWPAFEPPTDKAFANVMSRARTALGVDDDGTPYLSRAGADKTYRLEAAVTTDFDRFRAIVELADAATAPAEKLALFRQALELIRGVPFTGGSASSFAWADNHVRARVEYTIDESVHRCADLAIEHDDLATARAAVLKGLELVPGCEQCFRRRFLIASADKNRGELRRAMADLEASAMIDLGEPEAVDLISGELLDLYHELDRALVGDPR